MLNRAAVYPTPPILLPTSAPNLLPYKARNVEIVVFLKLLRKEDRKCEDRRGTLLPGSDRVVVVGGVVDSVISTLSGLPSWRNRGVVIVVVVEGVRRA